MSTVPPEAGVWVFQEILIACAAAAQRAQRVRAKNFLIAGVSFKFPFLREDRKKIA